MTRQVRQMILHRPGFGGEAAYLAREMGTTGIDVVVAAYLALGEDEQTEAFERLHGLRVEREAANDADMARFLRSMRRIADELGHTPSADEYREVAPRLVASGEQVESFSRTYRFFGSWPRAREALELSVESRNTPRRIEARFRDRELGKVWRYTDDDLRGALTRAAEHYGYAPSTHEFDWWRQREFALAQATGRRIHLPSATPYRKRWGSWEAALLHHGFSEEEVARRLTHKVTMVRDWDPDALVPDGLPMAGLGTEEDASRCSWALSAPQTQALREAYSALPRRSRYILTARLGLLNGEQLTLKDTGGPLALSLDRCRQIQVQEMERLLRAVMTVRTQADGGDGAPVSRRESTHRLRQDVEEALRALAIPGTT